jgi:hypothetical protein
MFHEYHYIPKSFKELWESIQAEESIPKTANAAAAEETVN